MKSVNKQIRHQIEYAVSDNKFHDKMYFMFSHYHHEWWKDQLVNQVEGRVNEVRDRKT